MFDLYPKLPQHNMATRAKNRKKNTEKTFFHKPLHGFCIALIIQLHCTIPPPELKVEKKALETSY